jgi:small nuclear ribonucleoprotein (snRNP)-like protein
MNNNKQVVIKSHSKIPVKILTESINYPVSVVTIKNKHNKGTLKSVVNNTLNVKVDDKIIKGNNIKYIVLPDIMRFNPLLNEVLEYDNSKIRTKKTNSKKKNKKKEDKVDVKDREIKALMKELDKRENRKRQIEDEAQGTKKQKL